MSKTRDAAAKTLRKNWDAREEIYASPNAANRSADYEALSRANLEALAGLSEVDKFLAQVQAFQGNSDIIVDGANISFVDMPANVGGAVDMFGNMELNSNIQNAAGAGRIGVDEVETYWHELAHRRAQNTDTKAAQKILKRFVDDGKAKNYPSQNAWSPEKEVLAETVARYVSGNAQGNDLAPRFNEQNRAARKESMPELPPEEFVPVMDTVRALLNLGPVERNPQIFRTAPMGPAENPLLAAIAATMPK